MQCREEFAAGIISFHCFIASSTDCPFGEARSCAWLQSNRRPLIRYASSRAAYKHWKSSLMKYKTRLLESASSMLRYTRTCRYARLFARSAYRLYFTISVATNKIASERTQRSSRDRNDERFVLSDNESIEILNNEAAATSFVARNARRIFRPEVKRLSAYAMPGSQRREAITDKSS